MKGGDILKPMKNYEGYYEISEDGKVWWIKNKCYIKAVPKGRYKTLSYNLYKGRQRTTKTVAKVMYENFAFHKDGFKDIPEFEGLYCVSKSGVIWSCLNNKELYVSTTTRSKYLYAKLWKDGKEYHMSVHRAVALTYIPNPKKLPIVDHIDRNIYNNTVGNLRWVTPRENLMNSEEGFVRNFTNCTLFHKKNLVGNFKSIAAAARYASKKFGASASGLIRNHKSKGCELKVQRLTSHEE